MQAKELSPKEKFLQQISNFLQKNRIILLILLIVIVAFIIVFAIVSAVAENRTDRSTIIVERVQESFDQWNIETDEQVKSALEEEIVTELEYILDTYPRTYAGQRGLFILGNLHFAKEEWQPAVENYSLLAERFADSYLAPVSLINAAVAHEESGDIESAITVYEGIVEAYQETFPQTPYVLFTLGRLYETSNDLETARLKYNQIIDDFSASSWTNLARNRIISLNVRE